MGCNYHFMLMQTVHAIYTEWSAFTFNYLPSSTVSEGVAKYQNWFELSDGKGQTLYQVTVQSEQNLVQMEVYLGLVLVDRDTETGPI